MSLDHKPIPPQMWKKGQSGNPQGRPKGSHKSTSEKARDRLLYKHKRHPADELLHLADFALKKGDLKTAKEIWQTLLEYVEPKKKPVESLPEKPSTPEESKDAVEATLKMLEQISDGALEEPNPGAESGGSTPSLDEGNPHLQAEAGPEEDAPGDNGEQ